MNSQFMINIQDEKLATFQFGHQIHEAVFQQVQSFDAFLHQHFGVHILETVPSYHMVTVFFKREVTKPLLAKIQVAWRELQFEENLHPPRVLTIPVCYEEPFASDLVRVAQHTGLSIEAVIRLHCAPLYTVYVMGFLPGFPYLGGLAPELFTPRLETPRQVVEAGSVGIGGQQTGVYPLASPGGWNLIGKTPVSLFDVTSDAPFLLQAGDQLKFERISLRSFESGDY